MIGNGIRDDRQAERGEAGGVSMGIEGKRRHLGPRALHRAIEQRAPAQEMQALVAAAHALRAAARQQDAGDGNGLGFAVPQGGKVVTKGSFTAWTVPADPAPGQNYLIVIQIELPDDVRRFPKRDLIGSIVIGTDGYRQAIPDNPRGFLPTKERQAQMVIPVPGAANLVRDTIQLQSKILKEKQTLQIVF